MIDKLNKQDICVLRGIIHDFIRDRVKENTTETSAIKVKENTERIKYAKEINYKLFSMLEYNYKGGD